MSLHFITTDNDRWGPGQERPLAKEEWDDTIWTLNVRLNTIESGGPVSIEAIRLVSGVNMWIDLTDGTSLGPFQLPTSQLIGRGAWQADTVYAANEVVSEGNSAYLVLYPHTSGTVFSEGATDGLGHLVYSKLIEITESVPDGGEQGMVLVKQSSTNRDTVWAYQIGLLPVGGVAGQVPVKTSSVYGEAAWSSSLALPTYGQVDISGDASVDYTNGECQRLSVIDDVTSLAITNFGKVGQTCKLTLEIWNTGAFTLVWPNTIIWQGGIAPTLSLGADKKDVFVFLTMDAGVTIYGNVIGQDYA